MANDACSDTGPVLHLHEIRSDSLLKIFGKIFISDYIKEELLKYKIENLPKNLGVEEVNKDQVVLLAEKYGIDVAEASVIWLCKSMHINLLLTDDLTAREVAMQLEIKPVGTVGIITRAFREGVITQKKTTELLHLLHKNSSLFITSELINHAINEIRKFNKV